MRQNEFFISRFSAWSPCIKSTQEWEEWAAGKQDMVCSSEAPEIKFTDSMLRRRISQISKMTIQVVHDILPVKEDTKILFCSFRGELSRQFKINKMIFKEDSFSPAVFSFSVFNAPVALASMALDLKGGYTAVYPANNSIKPCFNAAKAMLDTGLTDELVFVYADENIPCEYSSLLTEPLPPFAFGLLLSREQTSDSISLIIDKEQITPNDFLKMLVLHRNYSGKAVYNN